MTDSFHISIILPSYNYAHYLHEAVESILAHTHEQWELLIIDDGSQDDSVSIAHEYAARDNRIRILQHPDGGNHGLAATLLLGIRQSKYDTVAFLEADDVWASESLSVRLKAMQQPNTALVFNAAWLMVESERDIDYYQGILAVQSQIIAKRRPPQVAAHELMATNLITGFSCVMTPRDLLLNCDFNSPSAPHLDKWLWQQLSLWGVCRFVPQALTGWRLHGRSYISTYKGNAAAEDRLWRQKTHMLLADQSYQGAGLWLARHTPRAHSAAVRTWFKLRTQGLVGVLCAIMKRLA